MRRLRAGPIAATLPAALSCDAATGPAPLLIRASGPVVLKEFVVADVYTLSNLELGHVSPVTIRNHGTAVVRLVRCHVGGEVRFAAGLYREAVARAITAGEVLAGCESTSSYPLLPGAEVVDSLPVLAANWREPGAPVATPPDHLRAVYLTRNGVAVGLRIPVERAQ